MDPMREEPLLRKCCYVIPLKFCLQTWAVLKLAINFLAIGYITFVILVCLAFYPRGPFTLPTVLALFGVALLVDVGFLMALIVGVFKNSVVILQGFFIYELYVVAVKASFIFFICVIIEKDEGGIVVVTVGTLYILLDLCMIVILKSEMVKLRNKSQCPNV